MKKDLEWLKENANREIDIHERSGTERSKGIVVSNKIFLMWIDQLDEREQLEIVYKDILSRREFLFDNKRYVVVEKPEIPKEIGERIEREINQYSLYQSLYYAYNYEGIGEDERRVDEWVIENTEEYAQAWLNGFTVEELEE